MRFLAVLIILVLFVPTPGLGQSGTSSADDLRAGRLLVRGMTMLQAGDVASARASLDMALHLSPNNAAVLAALADAYAAAGQTADAIHYGARALSASPTDYENARKLAERFAYDGDVNSGVDALERHAAAAADLPSSLLVIRFLSEHGRSSEALARADEALTTYGPDAALLEAVLGIQPDEASSPTREAMLATIAADARNPIAALALLSDERLTDDAAERILERLLAAYPEIVGMNRRGDVEVIVDTPAMRDRALDPHADALAWLYRAEANPRDAAAWSTAAEKLLGIGRASLALQAARDASTFFPGRDELTALRIRAALGVGDEREVVDAARAALRFEAAITLAYGAAAWGIADDTDLLKVEAINFLRDVEPESIVDRLVGALALARTGSHEVRVQRLLEGTDREARSSSELAGLRGLVELERGRAGVAREWLELSEQSGVATPAVLDGLASILDREGEEASAIRLRTLAGERRSLDH